MVDTRSVQVKKDGKETEANACPTIHNILAPHQLSSVKNYSEREIVK